jgi:hypothetical protein
MSKKINKKTNLNKKSLGYSDNSVDRKDNELSNLDYLSKLSLIRQAAVNIVNSANSYLDRNDVVFVSKKIIEIDKSFVEKLKEFQLLQETVKESIVENKDEVSKIQNSFIDKENGSVVVRQVQDDRPKIKFK